MNYIKWAEELLEEAEKINQRIVELESLDTFNNSAEYFGLKHRIICLKIEERDLRYDAALLLRRAKNN
ncbi:MAG: hypothetical protein Q8876_01085 [Bacillota bacterium]|nr:hypothetical protein [Bacillota bacterium]